MTKLYILQTDDSRMQMDGMPSSSAHWPFPPAHCPTCRRHLTVGGFRHADFTPFRDGGPAVRQLWLKLKRAYRLNDIAGYWDTYPKLYLELSKRGIFCPVFTSFGPLNLCVESEVDVGVPYLGTVVCHLRVRAELQKQGFEVRFIPTKRPGRSSGSTDAWLELSPQSNAVKAAYFEMIAPVAGHAILPAGASMCEGCFRCLADTDEPLLVNRDTLPEGLNLFRVYERPGSIFATERLVKALVSFNCSNVKWVES